MWVTSRLWLHISVYFYSCTFIFVFLWKRKGESCYLPQLTSLHRSLSLRPDSESKLWVESTAGRRRSTHLNWFFYFTFLWAELFLCESYCRDRRHHCFVSLKSKQQNHPRILFRPLIASSGFRRISNALSLFDQKFSLHPNMQICNQIWLFTDSHRCKRCRDQTRAWLMLLQFFAKNGAQVFFFF